MNLIGIAQALIMNISAIAGLNDPQYKVTPVGFTQMLLENNPLLKVNNEESLRAGHTRTVKVRYMQRGLESDVVDVDSCATSITPEWKESEISHSLFSKIGIYISDENMRSYELQASQTIAAGGNPATPLMLGLYETILVKLNGLIQKMDNNLLAAQATSFGTNLVYGNNTANSIAFSPIPSIDNGIVKLMLDAQANEVNGELLMCGNGTAFAMQMINQLKTGTDALGMGAAPFKFYNDYNSVARWGANHFGVFAPGQIGLVEWNKNVGGFAGEKGGSVFFTIPIPVQLANGTLTSLVLDAQLKYEDCPIFDENDVLVADRGYKLLLSKHYGLWNAPADMYAVGDRLRGVNGSFHYIGTKAATDLNVTTITPAP